MPELKFEKLTLKSLQNERATYSFCELQEYIGWKVERVYFMKSKLILVVIDILKKKNVS